MSSSLRPPPWTVAARLLWPWDSPGKNPGVGCHCLLQAIFSIQRSNPGLLHCRQILYHLNIEYMKLKHIKTHRRVYAHTYMDTLQNPEVISCNACVSSKKNYFTPGPLTTSATVREGGRMAVQGPSSFRNASSKGPIYSSFPSAGHFHDSSFLPRYLTFLKGTLFVKFIFFY